MSPNDLPPSFKSSPRSLPQVLTSCSDSWIVVRPAHTWHVPSVYMWGVSALLEVLGADRLSVASYEMSVATDAVSGPWVTHPPLDPRATGTQ